MKSNQIQRHHQAKKKKKKKQDVILLLHNMLLTPETQQRISVSFRVSQLYFHDFISRTKQSYINKHMNKNSCAVERTSLAFQDLSF